MAVLWPYLFFVLFACCAFANALSHPFVHDEIVLILQNPHIAHFGDLLRAFLAPTVSLADANAYYRPMLELIYRLEYFFFNFDPFWWHLFNVILHGINAALVMRLLTLVGFFRSIALATALLFAVHPVQTESVACVAGISNLLMGFFVLLSLMAYVRDYKVRAIVYFLLALMTKEQAIFAIALFALIDWYRGRKQFLWLGGIALATLLFLSWRQAVTGSHIIGDILASPGELKLRLLSIAKVTLTNIRMLILPYDLHYYRSTDILSVHWSWWFEALIVFLAMLRLRLRSIWFGFGFFILALSPVLNIIPLVNEYSLIMTMEHFLYVPMVGIMLILVCLITRYCRKHAEQIFLIALSGFFFITWIQNEYWQSEIVLFERMVVYEPDFARGQYLLAGAYYRNKDYALANEHFARAYAIMEGYSRKAVGAKAQDFLRGFKRDILSDWAHSYDAMGYWQLSQMKYEQAISIDGHDPKLWYNLGVSYVHMGKANEAVIYFERALQVDPGFTLARQYLQQIK